MEKLRIISAGSPEKGRVSGYLKDNPKVFAEGSDYVQLVKNIIEEAQKQKKEKK